MNKHRQKKLTIFLFFAIGLSSAFILIIYALRQNLNVFVTPHELVAMQDVKRMTFRLGGMVKVGSVMRDSNNGKQQVTFVVTDYQAEVPVIYHGLLPDLFREGKGVVAEGKLMPNHQFVATLVLAKHDENYMPSSAYQAMRDKTIQQNTLAAQTKQAKTDA
jgi:cytochrome c-type biogenesis protein CcmE